MTKLIFPFLFLMIIQVSNAQFLLDKHNVTKYEGFFDFYYDIDQDKVFLIVEELDKEFLYVNALSEGLGSNDIALDRGQLGKGVVVRFHRAGNKLLLIQPNLAYRANTDNEKERNSIEEAFAKSVLYGFKIEEENEGAFLIDITEFLLNDAHGVARRLKETDQGTYSLDRSRSAMHLDRIKAFPRNVEFDAILTFTGEAKGRELSSVSPNSESVSVYQHHSFVTLPGPGFKPRIFDPRCGSFEMSYMDYASPVNEPIIKRFIFRHRLEKINPNKAVSEAKEPIIYYLDSGTPEPVRSALVEGASWWNQAFEAAGFKNAFQVKILPEDADPLDLRYNVIQWVHRSARGWSYGETISDPRTGEIIKGHVSLGSLRIRQDFLIAQALQAPYANSESGDKFALDMALARIRQLSAHEVGHTLGFAHNFAASTNNRSSVMDYPHPLIKIENNELDFSNAYAKGIGSWDKVIVNYAYKELAGEETDSLRLILDKAFKNGHRYISDADARPKGSAHAAAHLWDNGNDIVHELSNVLAVRKLSIERFSSDNIRIGEPYSVLEDVFVPLYFYHRYQTEAVCKIIGGLDYTYAVKGSGGGILGQIAPERQKQALNALMATISVETLRIPKDKLKLFPPRALGYERSRESFKGNLGVAFDPVTAVASASELTFSLLLHPERVNRLVVYKSLDPNQLGFDFVWDVLLDHTFNVEFKDAYNMMLQNIINEQFLYSVFDLLASEKVNIQAKALGYGHLKSLLSKLDTKSSKGSENRLHKYFAEQIRLFLKDPAQVRKNQVLILPAGSPIGSN